MRVKRIVERITAILGITDYELGKRAKISRQVLSHWKRKDARTARVEHLIRLREASKLSWSQFGKMLDEEFGGTK